MHTSTHTCHARLSYNVRTCLICVHRCKGVTIKLDDVPSDRHAMNYIIYIYRVCAQSGAVSFREQYRCKVIYSLFPDARNGLCV